ncbi:hypothetical protein PM082_021391 [Marasmius tenuissimus]|nr:hypothetical protein PM082_021391 [Marasmius tenuissimus]
MDVDGAWALERPGEEVELAYGGFVSELRPRLQYLTTRCPKELNLSVTCRSSYMTQGFGEMDAWEVTQHSLFSPPSSTISFNMTTPYLHPHVTPIPMAIFLLMFLQIFLLPDPIARFLFFAYRSRLRWLFFARSRNFTLSRATLREFLDPLSVLYPCFTSIYPRINCITIS